MASGIDEFDRKVLSALRTEAARGLRGYEDMERLLRSLDDAEADPGEALASLSPRDQSNVIRLARYAVERIRRS